MLSLIRFALGARSRFVWQQSEAESCTGGRGCMAWRSGDWVDSSLQAPNPNRPASCNSPASLLFDHSVPLSCSMHIHFKHLTAFTPVHLVDTCFILSCLLVGEVPHSPTVNPHLINCASCVALVRAGGSTGWIACPPVKSPPANQSLLLPFSAVSQKEFRRDMASVDESLPHYLCAVLSLLVSLFLPLTLLTIGFANETCRGDRGHTTPRHATV